MALNISTQSWWETDDYTVQDLIPPQFKDPALHGPEGLALVRAFKSGVTQQGWGLTGPEGSEGFMHRYMHKEFLSRRTEHGYLKERHGAAYVMRASRLMCVDIDGKNGGLEHISMLGALPFTLAEISKSGNGYHLFYSTDDVWDAELGFDQIPDQIGIVQGVDIRGVGCVYHWPTQAWNTREVAPLPDWLRDKLIAKKQERAARKVALNKINTLDETEKLVMHAELLDELKKTIPAGRRNTTLFAIGGQLKAAEVDDWQKHLSQKAYDVGLDSREVEKLISNIENYG